MQVINRSDGVVTYSVPDLRVKRTFGPGETKQIETSELESLFQSVGGRRIIQEFLLVDDREWVNAHWEAPIEYFW